MSIQDSLASLVNAFVDPGTQSPAKKYIDESSPDQEKQRFSTRQKNMKLINQIENDQAPYFGLNAKHHQHEDPYGGQMSARKSLPKVAFDEEENNFKMAKQISYDLSSEFKGLTPRQEGFVEECRIGEQDLIEFKEPVFEEEEEKEQEQQEPTQTNDDQSDDSSCESESSSQDELSATPSKSA